MYVDSVRCPKGTARGIERKEKEKLFGPFAQRGTVRWKKGEGLWRQNQSPLEHGVFAFELAPVKVGKNSFWTNGGEDQQNCGTRSNRPVDKKGLSKMQERIILW
jgi:hypothetical protein